MRTLTALVFCSGALACSPHQSATLRSAPANTSAGTALADAAALQATIDAQLDSLQAQSSFYAKQLSTGREIAIRADVPMNTASVIKIR